MEALPAGETPPQVLTTTRTVTVSGSMISGQGASHSAYLPSCKHGVPDFPFPSFPLLVLYFSLIFVYIRWGKDQVTAKREGKQEGELNIINLLRSGKSPEEVIKLTENKYKGK
jgi:hypothetical protein